MRDLKERLEALSPVQRTLFDLMLAKRRKALAQEKGAREPMVSATSGQLDSLSKTEFRFRGLRIDPKDIEAILNRHRRVAQSAVVSRPVGGEQQLVAYVVPGDEGGARLRGSELIAEWSERFDGIYRQTKPSRDPLFNPSGWLSSYSGKPLPEKDMREWLDDAIWRILQLEPRRVLEIGCGSGMLLLHLAPRVERYFATDISAEALAYVERMLPEVDLGPDRVKLEQRPAERLEDLPRGFFDTVVLNSVVQYFPSLDYLAEVLERAVEILNPGGAIFIGDVRSLPLREAFYTSLELFQADLETSLGDLRRGIEERQREEDELFIDPEFFFDLAGRLEGSALVSVHPKKGSGHHELTAFRYQVVIRLTDEAASIHPLVLQDWRESLWSVERLREHLHEAAPKSLCLGNLPNLRTQAAVAATSLLQEPSKKSTVSEILGSISEDGAVDPQAIWNVAASSGYEVELGMRRQASDGSFDVVLRRRDFEGPPLAASLPQSRIRGKTQGWSNHPLAGRLDPTLVPELRAYLAEQLPEHMQPTAYVALPSLPVGEDLKVDVDALPLPERREERQIVAPGYGTEERLVEIWRAVLNQDAVSVDDDFFALGGDSQLAARTMARIWREFGVDLPLGELFEHPTVNALGRRVEQERFLKVRGRSKLTPVQRESPWPLSWAQSFVWSRTELEDHGGDLFALLSFDLSGPLRPDAFRFAVERTVTRHEILRTAFPRVEEGPLQQVQSLGSSTFALLHCDFREAVSSHDNLRTRKLASSMRRPFDLDGPLVRCLLAQREEQRHTVLLAFHPLIFDRRSARIVAQELANHYRNALSVSFQPLPDLMVQYGDFVVWQRDSLSEERLHDVRSYWRSELMGYPALLLPTDRPRDALQSSQNRSEKRSLVLDASLKSRLRAMARADETRLSVVLLSAFQALAGRYSGQRRFLMGTLVDGRQLAELDPLIGPFQHALALPVDLTRRQTWSNFLGCQKRRIEEAFLRQDMPFEGWLEIEEEVESSALRVSLQMLDVAPPSLEWPELELEAWSVSMPSSSLEMCIDFVDRRDALVGSFEYRADLFDAATVDRFQQHLQNLLEAVSEHPDTALSEIDILSTSERQCLSQNWNSTSTRWPQQGHIPGLFATWAALMPNAVALIDGDLRISYGELDRRSAEVARFLIEAGIQRNARIGLAFERSMEWIVAMLGTLKASAAYLCLDMGEAGSGVDLGLVGAWIDDADLDGILADEASLRSAQNAISDSKKAPPIVPIDQARSSAGSELNTPIATHQLAQIFYAKDPGEQASVERASLERGSKQPILNPSVEGLAISHGSVVRLVHGTNYFRTVPSDRFAFSSPIGDPRAIFEVWGGLLNGAGLVILSPRILKSPRPLAQSIRHHHLDVLALSEQDVRRWQQDPTDELSHLYHLLIAGRTIDPKDLRPSFELGKPRHVIGLYSPERGALFSAWYELVHLEREKQPLPIGRPLSNVELHVVTPDMRLAPVGVPGELLIGGDGLSQGFWRRPRQTAQAFVPHGLSDRVGQRLFKTGDLARRRENGTLEFLGRMEAPRRS